MGISTIQKIQTALNAGHYPLVNEFENRDQYEFCHHLGFLKKIFSEEFEEIILHSVHNIEIRKQNERHFIKLDVEQTTLDLAFELYCFREGVEFNSTKSFNSFDAFLFNNKCRISLLHRILGNSCHKYFIRSRERISYALESFGIQSDFLPSQLMNKKNILIAGKTGSGKTSLCQSLLQCTDSSEHKVLIEDVSEIHLQEHQLTHLISDRAEQLRDFIAYALRLSPDRLVLGEIRSHEVVPFFMAMNTGQNGLISTIHANSAYEAMFRAGSLFQLYSPAAIDFEGLMKMLCRCIDLVIYIENKRITECIQILGYENYRIIFERIKVY